jgi:HEAT repeat protein
LAGALWLALATVAFPADPEAASPAGDPATLAAAGRYAEAYAALKARGSNADSEALRELARATLIRGIDSQDAFERWAALRAARRLKAPELAAAALRQLESDSRYEQALALEILARNAPEISRAAFVTALASPHRTVRLRALRALHDAEQRSALQERIAVMATDDPDPDIRIVAIRTLRDWRALDTLPHLRRAVGDKAPAVREEAVMALVVLADPPVADIVQQRIAEASDGELVGALRLAGMVPSRNLLSVASPYLSHTDPEVRIAAAAAILSITSADARLP